VSLAPRPGDPAKCVFACLVWAPLACGEVTTTIATLDQETAGSAAGGAPNSELPSAVYFEAESGELSGGFTRVETPAASGGETIAPPDERSEQAPGSALARYEFEVAEGPAYVLWGRLHAPSVSENRFWLRVDDGAWHLWRITTGDVWYWDDVHQDKEYGRALVFSLTSGTHELSVANATPHTELDRFYLTAEGDVPPGNTSSCNPPHSVEFAGVCRPSCGSLLGTSCGVEACAGFELLDAYDCDICCRTE